MPKLGSREFPKSVCFDQVPVTAFLAFEHESKYTQSEPQRPFPFQRKGTWVEGELVEEGRQEPTDSIRMQPQHHGHSQASNLPCFLGRLTWWLRGKESACNMRIGVQLLGQEDPWRRDLATYSSILAWRIPRTEESDGLQSTGSQSQT